MIYTRILKYAYDGLYYSMSLRERQLVRSKNGRRQQRGLFVAERTHYIEPTKNLKVCPNPIVVPT